MTGIGGTFAESADLNSVARRASFMDRLDVAMIRTDRRGGAVVLMLVDIDRFNAVNRRFGYRAADQLLKDLCARIQAGLRPSDSAIHLHSDHFVILCDAVCSERDAGALARRVTEAVDTPLTVESEQIFLTASIGVAFVDHKTGGTDAALRQAYSAMYRAKEKGGARAELFDEELHRRAMRRLEMEGALRRAVERDELRAFYQPQVDQDMTPVGVEALLRWQRPGLGLVPPSEFISVAEESGSISSIGEWAMAAACHQLVAWDSLASAGGPRTVSVNLSAKQLSESTLPETVAGIVNHSGLAPERLCLEVTETAVAMDIDRSRVILGRLKALGVTLAIDDFGTGYCALAYLKRFPFDVLKVDRSFVSGLGREGDDLAITRAIIDLAHNLGLKALAEGVETADQFTVLRALGCDLFQGYYFGRPVPPAAGEPLGAAQRVSSRSLNA